MQAEFWHNKWEVNQIGFHMNQPNPLLMNHIQKLQLPQKAVIFVPLCGKTLDIAYILEQGFHVVGNELSEIAIKALFKDLELTPEITVNGTHKCYQAGSITIFVGDFFHLTPDKLGRVDAIYDRAALIALPRETRSDYCKHLIQIAHKAPQLLISLDYDQSIMNGPPFAVSNKALKRYYSTFYRISCEESQASKDGLKGQYPVTESVWLLTSITTSKSGLC